MSSEESGSNGQCATVEELTVVLVKAVMALGRAGDPVEASRLAAAGWSAVRNGCPKAAQKLNNVLHTLSNMPGNDLPRR